MHKRFLQRRRFAVLFGEKRLSYFETPEVPKNSTEAASEVERARVLLAEMKVSINKNPDQREKIIDEKIGSIHSEKLANAIAHEVKDDEANLDIYKRALAREKVLIKTAHELDAAKQEVAGANEKPSTTTESKEKGFLEGAQDMWNKSDVNPNNWSEETARKVQAAGVGIAVGVAAIAAWKFGRWFIFGTKKIVNDIGNATKRGFGRLGWGLLAGTGALAGYLGFSALQSQLNKIAAPIKKVAEGAQKTAESAVQAVENIGTTVTNAVDAFGEKSEQVHEHVKGQSENLWNTFRKKKDAIQLSAEQKQRLEEARNVLAITGIEKFWHNDKVGDVHALLSDKNAMQVLATWDASSKEVNMKQLGPMVPLSTYDSSPEKEKYAEAAESLVRFCAQHKEQVKEVYEKNASPSKSFEQLTFREYTNLLVEYISLAITSTEDGASFDPVKQNATLAAFMKEKGISVRSSAEETASEIGNVQSWEILEFLSRSHADLKTINLRTYRSKNTAKSLNKAAEQKGLEKTLQGYKAKLAELTNMSKEEFLNCSPKEQQKLLNEKETVSAEIERTERELRDIRIGHALVNILAHHVPQAERLTPLFHKNIPNHNWVYGDNNMHENHEAVRKLIMELKIPTIVRWYGYDQLLRHEDELTKMSGLVPLQKEILHLIHQKDTGLFGQRVLQVQSRAAWVSLVKDGFNNEEFKKTLNDTFGISFNLIESAGEMLAETAQSEGAKTVAREAGGHLASLVSWYLAARKETRIPNFFTEGEDAPLPVSPLDVFTGWLGWKATAPLRNAVHWYKSRTDIRHAVSYLGSTKNIRFYKNPISSVFHGLNILMPIDQLHGASDALTPLYSAARNLGDDSVAHIKNLEKWFKAGADPSKLQSVYASHLQKSLDALEMLPTKTATETRRIAKLKDALNEVESYLATDNRERQAMVQRFARPMRKRFAVASWQLRKRLGFVSGPMPAELRTVADEAIKVSEQATQNVLRLYRPSHAEHATNEIVTVLKSLNTEEAVIQKMLLLLEPLETSKHYDAYASLIKAAVDSGDVAKAERIAAYCFNLADDASDALRSEVVIAKVVAEQTNDVASIARTLSSPGFKTIESTDEALNVLSKIGTKGSKGLTGMHVLGGLGLGLEIGMVGFDIYNVVQETKNLQKRREELVESLAGAGFEANKEHTKFTKHGVTIEIQQLTDANDIAAWSLKTGVDAAGAAVSVAILAGAAAPGAGLVAGAIIITTHVAIDQFTASMKQYGRRKVLEDMPTWVLAEIGTASAVQQAELEVVQEHYGTMRSDYGPRSWLDAASMLNPITGSTTIASRTIERHQLADSIENAKAETRKKAVLAACYREIRNGFPELFVTMPGASGGAQEFFSEDGEFLRKDGAFDSIVFPYMKLMLLSKARGREGGDAVTLKSLDELNLSQTDDAWIFTEKVFKQSDLEESAEYAMRFYALHLRQERYRNMVVSAREQIRQKKDELLQARIAEINKTQGSSEWKQQQEEYWKERIEQWGASMLVLQLDELNAYVDKNKSEFFTFNEDPRVLPLEGDTVAQQRLKAWYAKAEEGGEDSITSDFDDVLIADVIGLHSPIWEQRLERYSESKHPKPFNFQEMEVMDNFEAAFLQTMQPLLAISEFAHSFSYNGVYVDSDAKLAQVFREITPHLEEFDQVLEHREFYENYLRNWRHLSPSLMLPYANEGILPAVREWNEQGRPTLIDEQKFIEVQQYMDNRVADPKQEGSDVFADFDKRVELRPRKNETFNHSLRDSLKIEGLDDAYFHIPGFDPDKDGDKLLHTYGGYESLLRNRALNAQLSGDEVTLPFTRDLRKKKNLFALDALASNRSRKPTKQEQRYLQGGEQNPTSVMIDGQEIPLEMLIRYQKEFKRCVAVYEEEVALVADAMSASAVPQLRIQGADVQPAFGDNLTELRQRMLKGRMFVMVRPDTAALPPQNPSGFDLNFRQ